MIMHKKIALIGIFVSFAFIINLSLAFAQTVQFSAGDVVQVTTNGLSVRGSAGLAMPYLGAQNYGVFGAVVEGPVRMDGYNWWHIDYRTGTDGWSVENYLSKTSLTSNTSGAAALSPIPPIQDTTPPAISI